MKNFLVTSVLHPQQFTLLFADNFQAKPFQWLQSNFVFPNQVGTSLKTTLPNIYRASEVEQRQPKMPKKNFPIAFPPDKSLGRLCFPNGENSLPSNFLPLQTLSDK